MTTVRTRIAPSPTGMLHLGTARTALFCWAFARHHGGQFILRIEDTDLERSTEHAVQVILDSMKWLELDYDEGPVRQTDRLDRYRAAVDRLIADGKAYHCYASKEELDQLREAQMARGEKPRYDGRWRPENAHGKTPPAGVKPVVRFRNPDSGDVGWNDLVKGPISISQLQNSTIWCWRAATAFRPTTSRWSSMTSTWASRTCCAVTITSITRRARSTFTARSARRCHGSGTCR